MPTLSPRAALTSAALLCCTTAVAETPPCNYPEQVHLEPLPTTSNAPDTLTVEFATDNGEPLAIYWHDRWVLVGGAL